MSAEILYAGDTSLATAAAYLAGVLTHHGLPFEHLASDQPIGPALSGAGRRLYIISDYPVNNWRPDDFETVMAAVEAGAGLLMIGGWESFHGQAGHYGLSPLAAALPVHMREEDDRVNSFQPWAVERAAAHAITHGLPLNRPPTVGGFNRIDPKGEAETILTLRRIEIEATREALECRPAERAPLLVVGSHGAGRTAAFASDVAPHWVGTLVDWGEARVTARAEGAEEVEVGCHYAEFLARLVRWTMGDMA